MSVSAYRDEGVALSYARYRSFVDEVFVDKLASLIRPARTVLDVGAGCGSQAAALARRGFRVLCVEPSAAMISAGRGQHRGLPYVQAVGERLPFADSSADAALLLYVVQHLDDPPAALAELGRVLRPGGRAVVVCDSPSSERRRFFMRYFPLLAAETTDPEEVRFWAELAGLRVVRVGRTIHWVYPFNVIDDEYIAMVDGEMFGLLRLIRPEEFERGLERLYRDRGRPIPPPEVTYLVLQTPSLQAV